MKHSICIANSLVSFFGDVTSGGCFAFCRVFFLLNFCFSLSGDDLQFAVGRWKSSSGVTSKSFPWSHQKGLSISSKYASSTRCCTKTVILPKNKLLYSLYSSQLDHLEFLEVCQLSPGRLSWVHYLKRTTKCASRIEASQNAKCKYSHLSKRTKCERRTTTMGARTLKLFSVLNNVKVG